VRTHYTFGDVDLAAERLAELARVFEPSMLAFLSRAGLVRARCVVDFGCGPGHTTRQLAARLAPARIVGIDGSARFIARARDGSPRAIEYREADLTACDLSDLSADAGYVRFVLTHLPEPGAALTRWADALVAGGRLLVQETAQLASDHPALARYYALVGELQRRHGQALHIGRELVSLVDSRRYRVVSAAETPLHVSGADMARLHAMNIQTWRHDDAARDFDVDEVERLRGALEMLAADPASEARVTYVMGELVLERLP
jgi:ubiquinone/menaquinone biosynthesis C-methylase UbiE